MRSPSAVPPSPENRQPLLPLPLNWEPSAGSPTPLSPRCPSCPGTMCLCPPPCPAPVSPARPGTDPGLASLPLFYLRGCLIITSVPAPGYLPISYLFLVPSRSELCAEGLPDHRHGQGPGGNTSALEMVVDVSQGQVSQSGKHGAQPGFTGVSRHLAVRLIRCK